MTATALSKRREFAERKAAEEHKKEPRVTELDLYSVIVEKGFKNTADDRTAHKHLVKHGGGDFPSNLCADSKDAFEESVQSWWDECPPPGDACQEPLFQGNVGMVLEESQSPDESYR